MISLYEIDQELEARYTIDSWSKEDPAALQQPHKTELQWLERIFPTELKDYTDVFSREASNILALH